VDRFRGGRGRHRRDAKQQTWMLALDELCGARFIRTAFRVFRRLFQGVPLPGQQKCSVMLGKNLPLDDLCEMTVAISERFVVLCGLDFRPVQRRIPEHDPEGMRAEAPLVDVAHGVEELSINRRIPCQWHRGFAPRALQLSLRDIPAGGVCVRHVLQARIAEFDDDVVGPADEPGITDQVTQESVQFSPAMQFPDHDERVLVELPGDLRDGWSGRSAPGVCAEAERQQHSDAGWNQGIAHRRMTPLSGSIVLAAELSPLTRRQCDPRRCLVRLAMIAVSSLTSTGFGTWMLNPACSVRVRSSVPRSTTILESRIATAALARGGGAVYTRTA